MAVTRALSKITARMKLNNGTDPSGNVKTVNQSMPSLVSAYDKTTDDTKLMAVVNALVPCLTKAVYTVEVVETYGLTD